MSMSDILIRPHATISQAAKIGAGLVASRATGKVASSSARPTFWFAAGCESISGCDSVSISGFWFLISVPPIDGSLLAWRPTRPPETKGGSKISGQKRANKLESSSLVSAPICTEAESAEERASFSRVSSLASRDMAANRRASRPLLQNQSACRVSALKRQETMPPTSLMSNNLSLIGVAFGIGSMIRRRPEESSEAPATRMMAK